jgi:hypothetical protein
MEMARVVASGGIERAELAQEIWRGREGDVRRETGGADLGFDCGEVEVVGESPNDLGFVSLEGGGEVCRGGGR